jgi:FKBP-type peptidyl-prolyl cis-trans isomerase
LKTGTKATLLIPSAKAYGGMSTGPIPAYSPLVFDIEIVGLTKGKK